MNDEQVTEHVDVLGVLRTLRRRWRVFLAVWILVLGAGIAYTALQDKEYSARAGLLFRDPQLDQKLFGTTFLSTSRDPAREGATNVKLVSLDIVARRTAGRLTGVTADDVSRKVRAEAEGQSDVVSVIATDKRPVFARMLANAYAEEYIAFRQQADRSKIAEARRLVTDRLAELTPQQRNGAEGQSLSERADQLEVLASLQTGNAELVQYAQTPINPSSPRVKRNIAIALLLGAILGAGLALLRDRLDRRIREPEDLEAALGMPVLGVVPRSSALSVQQTGTGTARVDVPPNEAEAFRMLRARLRYFNIDQEIRSILVTSAAAGEGKSTVSLYLAATAASLGSKVVLVETDLRRPTMGKRLKLESHAGLAEVVAHAAELADVKQTVSVSTGAVTDRDLQTFDLIPAGFPPPNPTELLDSQRMRDLIDELEEQYDLVLIDTAPVLVVSDSIPLIRHVDGVMVVSRLDATTRDAAGHLAAQLRGLDASTLGVVANAMRSSSNSAYYYYANEYSTPKQPAPTAD